MALTKIGKEGITGISNSSDANVITIDSSERVGIGTSSPSTLLMVEPSARTTNFSASDYTTYADILVKNPTNDSTCATGIAFITDATTYTNGASGIACVSGSGDTESSLAFITRPLNAVAAERMRITSEGYLTQSKLPMFNVIGGSHTIAATGQTTITSSNGFGGLEYDPDNLFNHTNGRFTAPVAGRYFFIFSIGVIFSSGYHYSYLFKNGANISGLNRNVPQNTQIETVSIQAVLNLAAGDYVTAERNNNNISGSVDGAMFSGFLLG